MNTAEQGAHTAATATPDPRIPPRDECVLRYISGRHTRQRGAAVGVPSEYGEEDVLAVVAPAEAREIDPTALTEFLQPRLPYFMVPRYVRTVDDLPRTPTAKVRKVALREDGLHGRDPGPRDSRIGHAARAT